MATGASPLLRYSRTSVDILLGSTKSVIFERVTITYEKNTGLYGMSDPRKLSKSEGTKINDASTHNAVSNFKHDVLTKS